MYSVAFKGQSGKSPFSKILQTFHNGPSLAFEKVLSAETIEKVFRKHDGLFGGTFYNTRPLSSKHSVLWTFLLQTLSDGKYHNDKLHDWPERHRPGWRIEIKKKPDDAPPGFVVIAKRWGVDRTFAWTAAIVA